MTKIWLLAADTPDYTAWVRASTGRLCIDVADCASDTARPGVQTLITDALSCGISLASGGADLDRTLLSRLTLEDVHRMVASMANLGSAEISFRGGDVALGSIWSQGGKDSTPFRTNGSMMFPATTTNIEHVPWSYMHNGVRQPCELTHDGWVRILPPSSLDGVDHLMSLTQLEHEWCLEMGKHWIAQANYASCVNERSDSHFIASSVRFRFTMWHAPEREFTLRGTFMTDAPSDDLYLFIACLQVHMVDAHLRVTVPPPDAAFYWSLDPQGLTRLTAEMAEEFCVPQVLFQCEVLGPAWTASDYALVRQFHIAKGFDPNSQDAAIRLGYPLVKTDAMPMQMGKVDMTALKDARHVLRTYPRNPHIDEPQTCKHCTCIRAFLSDINSLFAAAAPISSPSRRAYENGEAAFNLYLFYALLVGVCMGSGLKYLHSHDITRLLL
ncbi:hypothetical protein C8R43DRAFT_635400 [Mycena crocata]|nr:hypothetical protein C8R43DRAFT_635400 [Mycena crocata]